MSKSIAKLVVVANVQIDTCADPATALVDALGMDEFAFVVVMVPPSADIERISHALENNINADHVLGARTAGEIGEDGYTENCVVALGFPKSHFSAGVRIFEGLAAPGREDMAREVLRLRHECSTQSSDFQNEFAFLLVDGLSRQEDALLSQISTALGTTQLFGGSSGDGLNFQSAPVFYGPKIMNDAAILLIARSNCRFKVFREDHFEPSQQRLVVTGAIPEARLVTEINAEPAAPEYARVVGIDPHQLSPFIFAAHPIVVSVGSEHHVRAIQRVDGNKLRFFSAIDEGMVLTVAHTKDITKHLKEVLETLSNPAKPDLIFACDCILRRLEAEQKQEIKNMSKLLKKHRVFGFSTYGEQNNMLHVNQTLTGIAIYPPDHD